jgi:hypothetical protein
MTRDLTATDLPTVEPGRQRTTWRNASECAHRWAANRHAEGKAGNVFFRNGVIYSYGSHFPIARHVRRGRGKNARQFVLFTSRGYSGTTAGHKSDVRRAIPHGATVFTVDNVLADTPAQHLANLKAIGVEAAYALEKAKRARANRDVLSREAAGRVASGNRYAEAVGIRQRLPEPERLAESHAKQTAREKAAAERARKKRAADLAERVAEWEAKLAAWQAGRGENPGYHPGPRPPLGVPAGEQGAISGNQHAGRRAAVGGPARPEQRSHRRAPARLLRGGPVPPGQDRPGRPRGGDRLPPGRVRRNRAGRQGGRTVNPRDGHGRPPFTRHTHQRVSHDHGKCTHAETGEDVRPAVDNRLGLGRLDPGRRAV